MRGFIIRRDYSVMRRANNWVAPGWMRAYVIGSTRAGDGWLWYAMGVGILLFGGENRFRALGAAGAAAVLSILLFSRSNALPAAGVPTKLSRTAGPRFCRPINSRFPPATP